MRSPRSGLEWGGTGDVGLVQPMGTECAPRDAIEIFEFIGGAWKDTLDLRT